MSELRSRAVHSAAQDLKRRISEGVYGSGQQIPAERFLAEEYGLARNTLRQALKMLEDEGVLVRHVGKGTFVNPEAGRQGDGPTHRMRQASPEDVMEVRLMIEPRAASLAAIRASESDLEAIDTALRHAVNATGVAQFEHWDGELHLAIFEAAKNSLLAEYCRTFNDVRNQPGWYQLKKQAMASSGQAQYHQQHTAIVTALKDRDGKLAAQHMRDHIISVRGRLLKLDDEDEEFHAK